MSNTGYKNTNSTVITCKNRETRNSKRRSLSRFHGRKPSGPTEWGLGDLNPYRRVSTTGGATPSEIMSHRSSYSSQLSANPFLITLYNWSPLVYQVSLNPRWNLMIRFSLCASSVLSFFFSFSSCAISNAGCRVSSRRVSLSS